MSTVPKQWKSANVLPLPKEFPLNSCSQLNPISLTNVIMPLFERAVLKSELAHVMSVAIDSDQFTYKTEHNSTMALIKCQHTWLEWLDEGRKFVRIFSFDFNKVFDTVPHNILCDKLKSCLSIHISSTGLLFFLSNG